MTMACTIKTTIIANLTMIVAKLALARSVSYNRKVRCKLKRTFMIVNYDPKPFTAQATDHPCKIPGFLVLAKT